MIQTAVEKSRDTTLDTLRAIAIFGMVQANIGQSVYQGAIPQWVTLYIAAGSFVPALFILLAGMSVVYTTSFKNYTLKHYLLRMGTLFVTAAIVIDVFVWKLVPFLGMDVLYLIGLSLPVAYVFQRLSTGWRWFWVIVVFMLAPILQRAIGYAKHPISIEVFGGAEAYAQLHAGTVIRNWFVDGWFPIVPWLGFALVGVNFGILRLRKKTLASFAQRKVVLVGILIVVLGIVMWKLYSGPLYSRSGFREIFYPPTLAYIVTVLGQFIVLFAFVDWKPNLFIYKPFLAYGESALFMYWTHHIIIKYVKPVHSVRAAFIVLGIGVVVTFGVAYPLRHVRRRWPNRPAFLRYVLGI